MLTSQDEPRVESSLLFGNEAFKGHEQVVFCYDEETGLKAIIGIHNTVLGPALGGTRMWNYANEADAVRDVLRLSRGMTYKASISGLNLGGGKAVIIGDSRTQKTDAMMERFGKFVDSLSGKYITAEDVGINTHDIACVAKHTKSVTGVPVEMGGSGDPSPVTAYGVYMGMKAAAQHRWDNNSLAGKRVMVQGVGHVGESLVQFLTEEGATVMVSDIHEDRLEDMRNRFGAIVVGLNEVYSTPMDIYAPCALGATVNDDTLNTLGCSIIAGAANNQLADEVRHGQLAREKGILYAPDFLINAGGLINVYSEIEKYDRAESMRRTENIYNTTLELFKLADQRNITPHQAALMMAEERIERKRKEQQG